MTKNWHYNKKVGIEKNNSLGNTNTPPEVATLVVEKLVDLSTVTKDSRFLEPCVGVGSFYFAMVDHLAKKFDIKHILNNMIYAYEIDPFSLEVLKKQAKKKYKMVPKNIFLGNFITTKIKINFDYAITNPPYIASSKMNFDGFESREKMIEKYQSIVDAGISKKADMYVYFFIKTLQLLKEGGKQILLCSDSWLDTNFGDTIKSYLSKDYNLDLLVSYRLHSLFRDDTSPVLTVVSKSKNDSTRIYQLDENEQDFETNPPSFELSKKALAKYLNDQSVNKRNLLVLFGKEYLEGESFKENNQDKLIKFKDLIAMDSSSVTFNDLKKQGVLIEGQEINKIFFQIQARINKPPNYKNSIKPSELLYSLDVSKNVDIDLKQDNAYLSTIIDRYPLVFYVKKQPTYHVSKYLSLSFIEKNKIELMPIVISNLVSLYMIEVFVKEGTRKTLRVGEMGFGKELRKSELENLSILNLNKLSSAAIDKILAHQKNLEKVVVFNIEEALKNVDYVEIQKIILSDLNISLTFEELKEQVLNLYFRRMRNVKKLIERSVNDGK
jgi:methylase of polypeptide subunit release factors